MAEPVTTTLVVNFTPSTADGTGLFTAEIDSRDTGLNNGKTSFEPGDSVGILVYKSDDVSIDQVRSSSGSVANLGLQSVTHTESIQFEGVATATLSRPAKAISSMKWLGNDGGAVTLTDGINLSVANALVGVLKVTYTSEPRGYRLSGVPHPLNGETEYDVLVQFDGSN